MKMSRSLLVSLSMVLLATGCGSEAASTEDVDEVNGAATTCASLYKRCNTGKDTRGRALPENVRCVEIDTQPRCLEPPADLQSQREPRFEVYKGQDDQFYFRLVAANYENVLRSEGYSRRADALRAVARIRELARTGGPEVQVETAGNDEPYFNLKSGNKVIATGETYASKSNAERGAETVKRLIAEINKKSDQQTDAQVIVERAARKPTWQLYTDASGKARYRLVAANHAIVLFSTKGFSNEEAKSYMQQTHEVALPTEHGSAMGAFEVKQASDGQWYVAYTNLLDGGPAVLARSETYRDHAGAMRAVKAIRTMLGTVDVSKPEVK